MRRLYYLCLVLIIVVSSKESTVYAQSQLQETLETMYTACLFRESGPFSQAVDLAKSSLAPGLSNFVESSLSNIPLTPPKLEASFVDGEIVSTVTGFASIFSENSSTVGKGRLLAGTSFSYFDLTKIRGEEMSDLTFAFEQDGGGDIIQVNMPFGLKASVFTFFGTLGISDRLDIGIALPFVNMNITRQPTRFQVIGSNTGCRYNSPGCVPGQQEGFDVLDYTFAGGVTVDAGADGVDATNNQNPSVPENELFLASLGVRAKYRFPSSSAKGNMAAVLDLRLPVGRTDSNVLGESDFGWRITIVGEYQASPTFKPYVNIGAHSWNGLKSNFILVNSGFSQQLIPRVFLSFDLLAQIQLENDPFLSQIDNRIASDASLSEISLNGTTIPAVDYDHTLNTGLGLQFAVSPTFYLYGSALFALTNNGLQSEIAPAVGGALYF